MDHLKPYAHIGINPDQSMRFVETRGVLNNMRREIDSKLMGRVADDLIEYSEQEEGKPVGKFIFQVTIDEPTRTITPKFEEAHIDENPKGTAEAKSCFCTKLSEIAQVLTDRGISLKFE